MNVWTPIRLALMASLITSAVAMMQLTIAASPAEAHISKQRFGWYWHLGSKNPSGEGPDVDPLNVLWFPGSAYSPASEDGLQDMIETEWRGRPSRGQMNHGQICHGQGDHTRVFGDGRQKATFRSDNGTGRRTVTNEFQESTSTRCFSQYHLRMWMDQAHDDATASHGDRDQWGLSGIHRDISRCKKKYGIRTYGGCHKISGRWNGYRNYAVNRAMRSMCGRSRWRLYPGGDRKFQGHPFDGYIALVKGTRGGSNCPRSLY